MLSFIPFIGSESSNVEMQEGSADQIAEKCSPSEFILGRCRVSADSAMLQSNARSNTVFYFGPLYEGY